MVLCLRLEQKTVVFKFYVCFDAFSTRQLDIITALWNLYCHKTMFIYFYKHHIPASSLPVRLELCNKIARCIFSAERILVMTQMWDQQKLLSAVAILRASSGIWHISWSCRMSFIQKCKTMGCPRWRERQFYLNRMTWVLMCKYASILLHSVFVHAHLYAVSLVHILNYRCSFFRSRMTVNLMYKL